MDPIDREREVDRWLDAALSQYGNVEPRAGLESRVLANLQSASRRRTTPHGWWWALGMIAATLAIVAAMRFGHGVRETPQPLVKSTPSLPKH